MRYLLTLAILTACTPDLSGTGGGSFTPAADAAASDAAPAAAPSCLPACKWQGMCTWSSAETRCVVATSADCLASDVCRDSGSCSVSSIFAASGAPIAVCQPMTDADCKHGGHCAKHEWCYVTKATPSGKRACITHANAMQVCGTLSTGKVPKDGECVQGTP